jgi:hypothetical protein
MINERNGIMKPAADNLRAHTQATGQAHCSPQAAGFTTQHNRLQKLLKASHTGKIHAITSAALCQKYENYYHEPISRRTLRKLKYELNTLYGACICSGEDGYYIAATQREIDDLEKYLYAWIESISHEVKKVKGNFYRAYIKDTQADLFSETGGAGMKQ